ncbi:LysR family transcriptional regulator [Conexibacter sp. SYSU D00693]|uniref:LysR family transcriptional regulator n=1 Tax=Conexibacter sp. SYSU D00693 TaxID=2812560 RepID=UPI00196B18B3|nr:LysR family transcriptional regulator [Conexibacter sp. SYSU D00693]
MDVLGDAARLRAFLAVADRGSFTAAARVLGVSQPTVSSHVAALERRAGAPLVERSRAGARLTPAGEALRPHAAALLAEAEAAGAAVERAVAPERRHLRLGGGEVLTTHVLPPALARLRARLPSLLVDVLAGDEATVVDALRQGRVDGALLTDRAPAAGLVVEPFARDALVCLLPAGHPLAERDRVRLTDLRRETLVVRHAGAVDRREVDALLAARSITPAARLVAGTAEGVRRSVSAGLGVGLVPGVATAGADQGTVPRPLAGAPRFTYALATLPTNRPPLADALLAALREERG